MKKPIVSSYYQGDKDHQLLYFIHGEKSAELRTHDCGFATYDYEKDQFVIYELSKALGMKHGISFDIGSDYKSSKRHFELFLKHTGLKNDFSMFLNGQFYDKTYYMPWNRYVSGGFMGYNEHLEKIVNSENHYFSAPHHVCHTYCGYVQSPFSKCAVLSFDANSNETFFRMSIIDKGQMVKTETYPHMTLGKNLNRLCRLIRKTLDKEAPKRPVVIDLAGKMMGISAYGEYNRPLIELCKKFLVLDHNYDLKTEMDEFQDPIDLRNYHIHTIFPMINKALNSIVHYATREKLNNETIALSTQIAFEELVIEFLGKNYSWIQEGDNNLIVTGGCALNVLTNERIKRTFGCEVYVPPNPNDSGLAIGAIAEYLFRTEKNWSWVDPKNRKSLRFASVGLNESTRTINRIIKDEKAKETDLREISRLIKSGKIVGMISGNIETGPRALGHRSILCDPSIKEMKDTLNSRVKFREWYRPFAPICREEDAWIWFDTPNFKNMNNMSFVVDVKFEHIKAFPSITHEDGTARLQTVCKDDPDDQDMYELLGYFSRKPLLNTSFNVQGKPIINSLVEAVEMLKKSGLDHICLKHNDRFYLFG